MNAVVNGPTARADRTVMAQPPRPAATPTLADRDSVAAARASAHTAVIGISQPNVTAAAAPDAAAAASPSTAFRPNTAAPGPAAPSGR